MNFPITLIQGPGSHSNLIHNFLNDHCDVFDSFTYWPKFGMERKVHGHRVFSNNTRFDIATYLLYGLNHRLAFASAGQQLQNGFLFDYYDSICASKLVEPRALIGWTQTSLTTMRKNASLGGKSVLEHPMPHVDYWMDINTGFFNDRSIEVKPGYSRFSKGLVHKMRKEYEAADYVQVHSTFARDSFVNAGVDSSKILVCPLGYAPPRLPEKQIRNEIQRLKLLYVGRLELWKGVHLLLNAVQRFPIDELELTLVGRVMPEMQPFLRSLPENIRVVGAKSREELADFYLSSDVFVFPSLCDGFGLVILEAMTHGLPVIGSHYSAAPDIVVPNQTGLLTYPETDLAERIQWALDNREKLTSMAVAAQRKAIEEHGISHYFRDLEKNLQKVGFL